MRILEQVVEPIRSVQDWERRARYSTPSDEQIVAFYDEQLALLERSQLTQGNAGGRDSIERLWFGVLEKLRCSLRFQVLGAVSACAALVLVLSLSREAPLTFVLTDGDGQLLPTAAAGKSDGALPDGTKRVQFSDGTSVTLADRAEVVVSSTTSDGADLELKSGTLTLDVVPRNGYSWGIAAGPYMVRVKGTVFDVAWDAGTREFDLRVERGAVAVSGGTLQHEMLIVKGQRLLASERSGNAVLTSTSVHDPSSEASARVEAMSPEALEPEPLEVRPESSTQDADRGSPSDPGRVANGGSAGHSAARMRSTLEHEARSDTADQLLKRADVSRGAGDLAQAAQLLLQVRQRYPGTPQAALAAYTLGVTAFLYRRSSAEAVGWFQTHLRESPSGPLAREALGQLMEAQARMGDQGAARQSARRYLQLHPSGPHRHAAEALSDLESQDADSRKRP
ncbi:MAG: hypothetical protein RJA70_2178 [Pseudomonadota bacterium]